MTEIVKIIESKEKFFPCKVEAHAACTACRMYNKEKRNVFQEYPFIVTTVEICPCECHK